MADEQAQEQPAATPVAEPNPLSYGELKRREPGLYEFTVSRAADDPKGKMRFLNLHGGRFKMEPGKSRLFRFNLPMEARTLAQLAEDGYVVEEGGPPDPEAIEQQAEPELADAFANREEIAPEPAEPARKAARSRRTDETPEG